MKRRAPATWRRSPSLAFLASWFALITLAGAGSLWTNPAQAACPAVISLSVAHGGTVSYDASSCDPFGVNGNIEEAPLHGTAVSNTINSMVTYTHFGGSNTATSDTFVFDDASNVNHRINVTIGSASAITITPPTINVPQVGVPFSQALTASGGTAPYTYTIDSGSIPGLSLTSGGVLSGIPSHRPSSTVTIRATDNLGAFGLQSYTVDPANPTITASPTSPPNAAVSFPYSITFTGAGGITPYNFTLAVGSAPLPPGLSLSSAGVLSGTPTTANTYTFRIRVADSSTGPGVMFAEVDITLVVAAAPTIVVNPATVPGATVGGAYSQTLTGSGGVAPYTFAITAGALPAGLSLNTSTGGLSGTPTAAGTFNFTVRATDSSTGSGPFSGTRAYTLVVAPPVTVIAPPTLPNGTVSAAYSQTITASGGIAPYSYAVTAGALPAGLSLSSGGALTGTPTAGGTFNFTVTATGTSTGTGAPHTGSRAYALVIAPPTVNLPATTLANGTQSVAYSATLNPANGGTAPYTYAVTAGALPAGIALSAGGVLSGTPTAAGTFNFAVTATDSSTGSGPYSSAPRGYSLQIVNVPPVANPVSATVAQNSGANPITLNITGGVPTSVAIGTAPANGTAIASGLSITYQPNAGHAGPDSFTYTATNSAGTSAPATVTITVNDPVITLAPSGGFTAQVGVAYTNTFTWTGGTQPFTGLAATGLPAGLSVTGTTANSLTVSGTPTEAGSFNLNVTGTDSSTGTGPFTVANNYVLSVSAPTLTLTPPAGTLSAAYGVAYSQTYVASGGTAPYTYTISAGALPAGLAMDPNGTLSGTPTVTGLFTFSVRATDASTGTGAPFARTQNYVMQVAAPTIAIAPAVLPAGQIAVAYSQTLTATGGIAPYSFAVTAGSLPPGITLASDGTVAGTPTGAGTYNLTITTTDANGQSGSRAYALIVAAPTLAMTPAAGNLALTYGAPYTQTFVASGGTPSYSFSLAAGSLPVGISLSSAGLLSGTPTVPGNYAVTIAATDSSTGTGAPFTLQQNYVLQVGAPTIVINPATLPDPVIGQAYSQTITASGGVGAHTISLTAGTLPIGISLSSAGVLSGTPTAAGAYSLTIQASDANGQTATQIYNLTVAAPALAMTPAAGTITLPYGAPYTQNFAASGGIDPYTFSIPSGSLPVGISFSSAGVLSGTPTVPGSYALTIRVTDSTTGAGAPFSLDQNYVLDIPAPTIVIDPATLPTPVIGQAYSETITASGGVGTHTISLAAGTLPDGMTLTAGVLAGTPTSAGNYALTIQATDANGQTATQVYNFTIAPPTLTMTPPAGTLTVPYGVAYSQTFSATGGTAPLSFSITGGSLPAGISMTVGGVLSGTPTVPGNYPVTIRVTDSSTGAGAPFTLDQNYVLDIPAPTIVIDPATLADPVLGQAYSATITATGGVGTHTISLAAGTLPDGMTLTAGVLAGTPTSAGNYALTIQATDANGQTATQVYNLTIAAPTLTMTPPAGTLTVPYGVAYSQNFSATGGTAPLSLTVASGTLPAGLTFVAGVLSGTPTVPGSYPVTIRVTDSSTGAGAPFTLDQNYVLDIPAPTIVIDPPTLADPVLGQAYSATITATGGVGTHTISLAAGTLPDGMSFAAGVLSGTPTSAGTYALTIQAADANGQTATQIYNLTIAAPALTMTPASGTLNLTYGAPYSQTFVASGGIAPHSYTLSGALPAGVTFGSGVLSGTPTVPGTYSITIQAADSSTGAGAPFTVTNSYTLQVDAPTITIAPATLPNGIIEQAYSQALSASGGVAPHSYSIVSGTLPAGLTLSSAGAFSGTPTAQGSYNFTVRATDTYGQSGDAAYTLQVIYNAPVAVADNAATMAGQAVTIAVTSNDTGDITSIAVASAPANGTATVDGFNIVYTPADTFGGTDTFTYVAVGPGGTSAPATVSIDVALRDDPTEDAEVMGILNAQTAATRRFANSQIGNFQQRMEGIHDEGGGQDPEALGDGVTFLHGLSLNITDRCTDAERVETNCGQPGEMNYTDELGMGDRSLGSREKAFAAFDTAGAQKRNRLTVWTGGVVNFGEQEDGTDDGVKFTTTGVSAGADYRLNQYLTLGAGLGYGRDDSDIGDNGSTSDGESYTAALYGSYKPNDTLFVDALVGYQWLSFDSQRYVTQTGGFVDGERDGHQIFASLSAGAKFKFDEFMVSPYGRLDVARATLDAFTETGDALYALHYGEQDISTTTGTLGIRLNYSYVLPVGVFKPELRAEYQHDFEADSALTLNYADMMGGPFYRAEIGGLDRDRFVFGLGASLETENDMTMRFEYRGMFGSEGDTDHGFLLNLQKQF